MHGIGTGVGEHRDLGRAGLGVDADDAAQQPFGGRDVDVAGTGDQVHTVDTEARVPVGHQRDGLRSAHGVHLRNAEQRAGGKDARMGAGAELLLRW